MNYLAHAVLSGNNPELLTGNMIADFVKGRKILQSFPPGITKGILLHRFIDSYTDAHPAALRAALFFRQDYGLYSHAIVDSLFDHFLANDPAWFSGQDALSAFAANTYQILENNKAWFPDHFAIMFPYMKEHNWLLGYRQVGNMRKTLDGLRRRANYMPLADKAFELFIGHYYQLNQAYQELMESLKNAVKIELSEKRP